MLVYYIAVSSWDGRAYTFDYIRPFLTREKRDEVLKKIEEGPSYKRGDLWLNVGEDEFEDITRPIPIDGEILKKNGFEVRPYEFEKFCYFYSDDYAEIQIDEYSDSIWRVEYDNLEAPFPVRRELIGFVHELQQLFRWWGINKDIKL